MERILPRPAFLRDLQQFIIAAQQEGDAIILCGDFNETMSERNSGIAELAANCGLIDIFSLRLGDDSKPSTYQRGKRRLDYVLMSPHLTPAVKAAGYDPFGFRIVSDHRGYFIDFDTNAFCGYTPTKLATNRHRDFRSTDPHQLKTYLIAKIQYLQGHQWFERLDHLMESAESNHDVAEALDRDLQRASRAAGNAWRFSFRSPWSPRFANAWAKINFYKLSRSQNVNNQDYRPALQRLQQRYSSLPMTIPTDIVMIEKGYQDALAELRQARHEAQQLRDDFLQSQAARYTALNEQGKAHIVRRIQRAETMSQVYRKIQFVRNPHKSGGLSTLKVPVDSTIVEPDDMKSLPDDETRGRLSDCRWKSKN